MKRIVLTGEELDAFSKLRHMLHWRAGELKRIKRGYNRRLRRAAKRQIRVEATKNR